MPTKSERDFSRALGELNRLCAFRAGSAQDGNYDSNGKAAGDAAWNCPDCGFYNFGSRRRCRQCPRTRPAPTSTTTTTATNYSAGKGGGKGDGGKVGGKGKNGATVRGGGEAGGSEGKGNEQLRAKIRLLEDQVKTLKAAATPTARNNDDATGDDDHDPELVEADDDEDDAAGADVERLAALQRTYDSTLVILGAEDPAAKSLRARLEAARAKQRAGKPIFQQVQAAQRKSTRLEKQLETARAKLQELRDKRTELDKEIAEQSNKADACNAEVGKAQAELRELLERAKTEKGGDTQPTTTGTAGGAAQGKDGIAGAAAAWNAAKSAIEAQVTALPADLGKELRDAIATQYAAMESLLNKIPTPAPPPPPQPPQPHLHQQPPAPQGGESGSNPPTSAGTAAGDGGTDRGATSDGARMGGDGNARDADDAPTMLDVDDSVLQKLADIFADQTTSDGGGDDGGDDAGGDGGASNKSRKLREAQLAAARKCLNGPVPVRKPFTKNAGK